MCRQSYTSSPQIIPPDGRLGHLARVALLINLVDIPSRWVGSSRGGHRAYYRMVAPDSVGQALRTLRLARLYPFNVVRR